MESLSRQNDLRFTIQFISRISGGLFRLSNHFLLRLKLIKQHIKAKILSVGDSRAYLIDAQGKWQQITQDHSILSELLADFPDKKEEDFATIYGGVSSCLVADYSEFQDKICYQEIEIQQGESLLLCSDGLTDGVSAEVREKIWKQYDNDKSRLTVYRKLIEKQRFYDDLSVIICAF